MAITKIHAIQTTVNKAVDYICNPSKTDESILISSFGCSPQTAAYDFKFALSKTNQTDPNKAYHLIQAFMPGEVSYKTDIDESIKQAQSYEQFLELLKAKGYEIKGESFGENSLKYISFRSLNRKQFVRGSVKSLGANTYVTGNRKILTHICNGTKQNFCSMTVPKICCSVWERCIALRFFTSPRYTFMCKPICNCCIFLYSAISSTSFFFPLMYCTPYIMCISV